jgi:DNA-binding transcriptional LysR family regulator
MTMNLDLRLLSQFLTICSAPNMTAAGRKMGLSTPAVSQIVRRIEKELGVVLFERSSRGIRLTPAGNLVKERARDMLDTEKDILESLAPYRTQLLPKLRVHVVSTLANYVVPAVVSELNPMVGELQLKSGRMNRIAQDFLRGAFDILISTEAMADIPDIDRFRLCREQLIALVPAGLARERLSLPWLAANLPMIRYEHGGQMDEVVEAYLAGQGLNPPRTIECRTPAPIVELIARGQGWTISTPFTVAYYRVLQEKAAYMALPEPSFSREIFLIANSGRFLDVPATLAGVCRTALEREVQSWKGSANAILSRAVSVDATQPPYPQLRRA